MAWISLFYLSPLLTTYLFKRKFSNVSYFARIAMVKINSMRHLPMESFLKIVEESGLHA